MAAALLRMSRGAQRLFFSEKSALLHRAVHTSVWWDINSVQVPEGWDCSSIAGSITDALAKLNYSGAVEFSAYGMLDYFLDTEHCDALSSTGMKLTDVYYSYHVPHLSSIQMFHDIWFWTKDHPAPANCLLITSDKELSFVLHQLAMKRYGILLARTEELGDMETSANAIWSWEGLLAGFPPERTNS